LTRFYPGNAHVLGLSIHGESVGVGGFNDFRQKYEYTGIFLGSAP
jgi:hypothetical protein